MRVKAFIQSVNDQPSTLEELLRVHNWTGTKAFLGLYAYATQSGAVAFDLAMGDGFWDVTPSRWLFGIDYGRTQPQALKYMIKKTNAEVRVYDGDWVLGKDGFLPRRDFHMKSSFLINESDSRYGMVVGSGNFSSNGLRNAAECGASFLSGESVEFNKTFRAAYKAAELLWDAATPAKDIIGEYEDRWNFCQPGAADETDEPAPNYEEVEAFWIEAGYVTRNRGPDKPGNQIDMPRGMNKYFGFDAPEDMAVNSVIGSISFEPPSGELVSRNLRLGNNMMEKISLPIPEMHGFDMYDGKVLVFFHAADRFRMRALEAADFDSSFGHRLGAVRSMASGRRYGYIK